MTMPTNPQINDNQYSSVCTLGWRPLLLTGFILEWMRHHFSAAGQIEDSDLVNTLWKADNTTNILIDSVTRWNPSLTEKRPGLLVKRNDINVESMLIDDKALAQIDPVQYCTFFKGSHTIFCITKEGAEAEKLGTEVYREISQFAPVVRRILNFQKLKLQSVGAVFKIEEAKETFAVPITLMYAFQEIWQINSCAPKLKQINLSVFQP